MLKILMVCAIVSMVVDASYHNPDSQGPPWYVEGLAIWLAVAVVTMVTAVSDYQKEGEFLKKQLIEENSKTVTCMRDSHEKVVHRNGLKVGDIIKIENGMNIPVDGMVIQGIGVLADESAMTGESEHCQKESVEKCEQRQREHEEDAKPTKTAHDVPSPVLLSGTQIQTGQGWFLCVVVGDMTCEGQILAGLKSNPGETTPLQDKLEVIATDIGKLGMLAALFIFHALLIRQFIESMLRRRFDMAGGPFEYY
jgi:Ca2+ transporting ATPase